MEPLFSSGRYQLTEKLWGLHRMDLEDCQKELPEAPMELPRGSEVNISPYRPNEEFAIPLVAVGLSGWLYHVLYTDDNQKLRLYEVVEERLKAAAPERLTRPS